jgi:hypothetical protein
MKITKFYYRYGSMDELYTLYKEIKPTKETYKWFFKEINI